MANAGRLKPDNRGYALIPCHSDEVYEKNAKYLRSINK